METIKRIEWRPLERFRGRSIKTTDMKEQDGETFNRQETIPVPDHEVVCDICNDSIVEFPVCVVSEYALCKKCMKGWHISPGDTEYFETYGYELGSQEPNPGVNFGGRKR